MNERVAIKTSKLSWISRAITKTDVLKIFLRIAWESAILENKQYVALSEPLDVVGQMLGGWRGQTIRQSQKK